jgi:hypothetical protein
MNVYVGNPDRLKTSSNLGSDISTPGENCKESRLVVFVHLFNGFV